MQRIIKASVLMILIATHNQALQMILDATYNQAQRADDSGCKV
jgi:hypothetical protein